MQRDRSRLQGLESAPPRQKPLSDGNPSAKVAPADGDRFIEKFFAADPLVCPHCGGAMGIIASIEAKRLIRAILVRQSLLGVAKLRSAQDRSIQNVHGLTILSENFTQTAFPQERFVEEIL